MRGISANPGFSLLAILTLALGIGAGTTMFSVIKNVLRTAGNPVSLLNPVRREIWAVDRNVALTMTRTLEDFLSDASYAQPRFLLAVLGVFAGVGLVLVAVGVYSVIAYTVSRQTHEIGIRMALGASRGDVIGMVLRMGMWLVAIGLAVGLAASLVVNKVLCWRRASPHAGSRPGAPRGWTR